MSVVISRNEYNVDNKGRNTTLLTVVFYANLKGEFVNSCMENISRELYDNDEGDCISYYTENEQICEWEVDGYVVNKLLNRIKETTDGEKVVADNWKEDGINSLNEAFNVEDQTYTIEVYY